MAKLSLLAPSGVCAEHADVFLKGAACVRACEPAYAHLVTLGNKRQATSLPLISSKHLAQPEASSSLSYALPCNPAHLYYCPHLRGEDAATHPRLRKSVASNLTSRLPCLYLSSQPGLPSVSETESELSTAHHPPPEASLIS